MKNEGLIKAAFNRGFEYEKTYRGCAQSTVAAIQDTLGIRNDFVFKAASGFAAGCGMLCDGICGGYTGGIMMMSLFFGRRRNKFDSDREENYHSFHMAGALHDRFIIEYGTVLCKAIHEKIFRRSFDLWNQEEKDQFEEAGAHMDKCTSVVAHASAWSTEIILQEINKEKLDAQDFSYLVHLSE